MQIFSIAKMNIRHNALPHIALSALVLLLTPVLFGISQLGALEAAMPLEGFVALIGILLLTPVFLPEQSPETEELVSSKYVSSSIVYGIRVLYSLGILVLFILVFAVYMREKGCDISVALVCGTIADGIFLGGLGMVTSSLTGNTVTGYMVPVMYYAICFGGGDRLGKFYLFSMTKGDYAGKPWMFAVGMVMIGAALIIRQRKRI